jgi:hypothetical protein
MCRIGSNEGRKNYTCIIIKIIIRISKDRKPFEMSARSFAKQCVCHRSARGQSRKKKHHRETASSSHQSFGIIRHHVRVVVRHIFYHQNIVLLLV